MIGGNSFITNSLEYRFPISQDAGLMGILFLDMRQRLLREAEPVRR